MFIYLSLLSICFLYSIYLNIKLSKKVNGSLEKIKILQMHQSDYSQLFNQVNIYLPQMSRLLNTFQGFTHPKDFIDKSENINNLKIQIEDHEKKINELKLLLKTSQNSFQMNSDDQHNDFQTSYAVSEFRKNIDLFKKSSMDQI